MAINAAMLATQPQRRGDRACDRNGSAVARLAALAPVVVDTPRQPKQPRQRVRSKPAVKVLASRKARLAFLDHLMRSGDPALAAKELGLGLLPLFRQRATDSEFAADWHAAIGFAWEQVEHRVLAALLAPDGGVDIKVALAIIARRDTNQVRMPGRRVDSASVARLRAELRALAGPDAVKGK